MEKEGAKETDKKNKRGGQSGGKSFESASAQGRQRKGVCLQSEFDFLLWFFTSERCPAFSSCRTGGDRGRAERSHPRTSSCLSQLTCRKTKVNFLSQFLTVTFTHYGQWPHHI